MSTVTPYLVVGDIAAASLIGALVLHPNWLEVVVVVAGVMAALVVRGAHRSRLTLSALDDVPTLALGALMGVTGHAVWLLAIAQPVMGVEITLMLALTAALAVGRAGAYMVVREARRRGYVEHRVLIVGAGEVGRRVAQAAIDHPEFGLQPVGFLDAGPVRDEEDLPVPLLGSHHQLRLFVRSERVSEVIVAFMNEDDHPRGGTGVRQDAELVDIVRECDRMGCEIFSVPRFHELRHRSQDMDELWGIPLVRARRATWRSASWLVKRVLDVLVSAVALVLLAPVLGAVALAVRFEVGPRVLFRQLRVGLDGQPFTLLKFRSLTLSERGSVVEIAAPVWSINGDANVGPVGRFIRATSLDELPQLINIVRGEMSLVGPRPERPEFVAKFTEVIPRYTARHRAPAGLTGLAQVNGLRGDTSIEERARFDNYYIQNWSLWLDAKILARTVSSVLLRRGS